MKDNEEIIKLRNLNLTGETGQIVFSIKNKYIRITYFPNNAAKESGVSGFISVSMPVKNFTVLAAMIYTVNNSKTNKVLDMYCKSKNKETNELMLDGILTVSGCGNDINIGLKKTKESNGHVCKIGSSPWIDFKVNNEPIDIDLGSTIRNYINYICKVSLKYSGENIDSSSTTKLLPMNTLKLWSEKGTLSVSEKNGYPRFTFFPKEEEGFISAPMNMATFSTVAYLILVAANSDSDIKYEVYCKNRDLDTSAIILQSIFIIAKRGTDVILAIKKDDNSSAFHCRITPSPWIEFVEDNSDIDRKSIGSRMLAIAYYLNMEYSSGLFMSLEENHNAPNSKRSGRSAKPLQTPVGEDDEGL